MKQKLSNVLGPQKTFKEKSLEIDAIKRNRNSSLTIDYYEFKDEFSAVIEIYLGS